jgi:hypothetical protein
MDVPGLKKFSDFHGTQMVTGHGGLQGSETSRLTHFLENQLTDDGEVSVTRRQAPQEDSWYSYLLDADSTLGSSATGWIS